MPAERQAQVMDRALLPSMLASALGDRVLGTACARSPDNVLVRLVGGRAVW